MSTILVTGGSGFIAGHCLLQLAEAGHTLRTTVRSAGREAELRETLGKAGAVLGDRLMVCVANLTADAGWREAVRGCDLVLHVASPFPPVAPRSEDELIVPARDGALRVLRAARDAGARRVVLTSSFAAIGYGQPNDDRTYSESDWTDLSGSGLTAYVKSKTIAERAAWDFIAKEGGGLELAVVNPVAVYGPLLGKNLSTSVILVKRLLEGAMPGCPKLYFGVVDVRDVADLHIRAMADPRAGGERFLAIAGDCMSVRDMSLALRARLGDAARRAPTREVPNWLVRLTALRDPMARSITPMLGKIKNASNAKARSLLDWAPRSREDALTATGESLLRLGLVKAVA
jgi:nucleoside-diphosphate-sugar epimerase